MRHHRGVTITELIVVLAILAIVLSLFLPAAYSVRERARETICKNNLRQIHIGLSQLLETTKEIPPQPPAGEFGGWMVAILPYMEQGNLKDTISVGLKLADFPQFNRPPPVYICPVRRGLDSYTSEEMWPGHFVLWTGNTRNYASLYDAPIDLRVPWGSSPEIDPRNQMGPHHGGFHYIQNTLHGVQYAEGMPANKFEAGRF